MWREHVALTTSFPEASLPPRGSEASVDPETVRRKRLVYRSKQRGWLEVGESTVDVERKRLKVFGSVAAAFYSPLLRGLGLLMESIFTDVACSEKITVTKSCLI